MQVPSLLSWQVISALEGPSTANESPPGGAQGGCQEALGISNPSWWHWGVSKALPEPLVPPLATTHPPRHPW